MGPVVNATSVLASAGINFAMSVAGPFIQAGFGYVVEKTPDVARKARGYVQPRQSEEAEKRRATNPES